MCDIYIEVGRPTISVCLCMRMNNGLRNHAGLALEKIT